MLMAIYTLPTLLISGPFNLGLFGSSLLVPKQRAVTSTGAYRMDLRSACQGGQRKTFPHDTWTLILQPFHLGVIGTRISSYPNRQA